MNRTTQENQATATTIILVTDLAMSLQFLQDELGFYVCRVHPAENPSTVDVEGLGIRIRLKKSTHDSGSRLLILTDDEAIGRPLHGPCGIEVIFERATKPVAMLTYQPETSVAKLSSAQWDVGRLGMRYRELVPQSLGGRYGASHIHVPKGGTLSDYIHYHRVAFQMIYCYRGWVEVIYEDQGKPFTMSSGDCVLQPPEIRHQVLSCSDDLHVIEINAPMSHETFSDREHSWHNQPHDQDRVFGGQKFVRHERESSSWRPDPNFGIEQQDLGISVGTLGLAEARVLRVKEALPSLPLSSAAEFNFGFILVGTAKFFGPNGFEEELGAEESFLMSTGKEHELRNISGSTEILLVRVSAPDFLQG